MNPYDYILLDWDGSVAQTLNLWVEAADSVLRERGIEFKRSKLIEAAGGLTSFLMANTDLTEAERRVILEAAAKIVKERIVTVELYPHAADVLGNLKAEEKHVALVTSSWRRVITPLLKKFRLDKAFDVIICTEDTAHTKPHPEPLQKALALLGGTEDKAIMIGDSARDINAAANAGIDSALFYPPIHQEFYNLAELLDHNPTYVISDFGDIARLAKGAYAPN